MSFKDMLLSGKFTITGELAPSKGSDPAHIGDTLKWLSGCVDAVNVTDNQRACVKASSLAVSKMVLERGMEPIYQLTCRDRNRIALQSDLLGANMLGVRNVLALTGDHVSFGDHPTAQQVFDLDSARLVVAIRGLNEGHDMEGNHLEGKTDFLIGAVLNPGAMDLEVEVMRTERKVSAGAQFFQTQLVYDADAFKSLMKELPKGVRVLAGIAPLKSKRMAEFMNAKVPGVRVPKGMISELDRAKDPAEAGLKQAADIIRELRPHCSGIHVMAFGAEGRVRPLLELAGMLK